MPSPGEIPQEGPGTAADIEQVFAVDRANGREDGRLDVVGNLAVSLVNVDPGGQWFEGQVLP